MKLSSIKNILGHKSQKKSAVAKMNDSSSGLSASSNSTSSCRKSQRSRKSSKKQASAGEFESIEDVILRMEHCAMPGGDPNEAQRMFDVMKAWQAAAYDAMDDSDFLEDED